MFDIVNIKETYASCSLVKLSVFSFLELISADSTATSASKRGEMGGLGSVIEDRDGVKSGTAVEADSRASKRFSTERIAEAEEAERESI